MARVVHLKWGERPPAQTLYLLVTRRGRVRGEDFYVGGCEGLADDAGEAEAGPYESGPYESGPYESGLERLAVEGGESSRGQSRAFAPASHFPGASAGARSLAYSSPASAVQAYASLASALREAESVASHRGVDTIYVQLAR